MFGATFNTDALWASALEKATEAAERAKSVAQVISEKGMELAEATAEEANKKFKDFGLADAVTKGALPGPAQPAPPSEAELVAYGVTPAFVGFIRSLNYNNFRDFPSKESTEALPTDGSAAPSSDVPTLNPWQVRHALLVVRAVNEVNELRYVMCPRYMNDQRFWEIYFALAKDHLPKAASAWNEGDPLPALLGVQQSSNDDAFMSLGGLQVHFQTFGNQIGSKLQEAAEAASHLKAPGGVELTSMLPSISGFTSDSVAAPLPSLSGAGATAGSAATVDSSGALLEADPDLEAYLQVADEAREGGYEDESVEQDVEEGEEDDLDLDQYLNELSAEVDAAEKGGGAEEGEGGEEEEEDGVDVDAVLKELEEEGATEEGQEEAAAEKETAI